MELRKLFNFLPFISTDKSNSGLYAITSAGGSKSERKNLQNYVFPSTMNRIRQDLAGWMNAVRLAEEAFLPFRWNMQEMYEMTVLNEHVAACMERRKDLTLLREFEIQDESGVKDAKWTEYFQKKWFTENTLNYILDALYYGYNLISIGDIVDGVPINPTIVQRRFVSPDRYVVSSFQGMPTGKSFLDPEYEPWHIFVKTLSTNGISNCGYGLLYNIAKTEIYLRNNLAFNTDFIQMFAQPYRVLKTSKTEGPERDAAEAALQQMGNAGYLITDMMDELSFMTDGAGGNGYKSYNDFEHRAEVKISKYILGHADAIDSVPGKIGSSQLITQGSATADSSAATPIARALRDKQSKDGAFVEPVVNEEVMPKLRKLGVPIPRGLKFVFLNDAEKREIQNEKNTTNQAFATLAMTLSQAGKQIDNKFIEETMGFPSGIITDVPQETAGTPSPTKSPSDAIKSGNPFKDSSKNRDGKQ